MLNSVVTTNCKIFQLGGRAVTGSGASGEQVDIVSTNGASVKINGIVPTAGGGFDPSFPLEPPEGTAKIINGTGDIDLVTGNINTPGVINCGSLVSSGGSGEIRIQDTGVRSSTLTEQSLVMEVDLSTVVQGSEKIQLTEEGLQVLQYAGTTYNTHTRIGSDGVILDGRFNGSTTSGSLRVGGLSQAFYSQVTDTSLLVENGTETTRVTKDAVKVQNGAENMNITKDGIDITSATPKFDINGINFFNAFVNAITTYEAVNFIAGTPNTYTTGLSTFLPINPGTYEYNLFNNTQTLFSKYIGGVRDVNFTPAVLTTITGGVDLSGNDIMPSYDIGVRLISPSGVGGIPTFPPNTAISGVGVTPVSLSSSGLECMISGYNIEPPLPAHNSTNNYFPLTQNWGYINSSLAQALTPVEPIEANIGTLNYLPCVRYLNSALRGGVNINYPVYRILNSTYGVAPSVAGSVTWAITMYPQGLMPHPRAAFS